MRWWTDLETLAADGDEPRFAFTGAIHSVADLSGDLINDKEAELARTMAQQ